MTKETKMGWKKYLLIGSLALNVLVLGLLAGAFVKVNKTGAKFQEISMQGPMIRALPEEQRKALRGSFMKRDTKSGDRRSASRQVRQDFKAALTAVPFDPQALRDVFKAQRSIRSHLIDSSDEVWIDVISGMSDAQRATFAAEVEFRKPRKKKPKN